MAKAVSTLAAVTVVFSSMASDAYGHRMTNPGPTGAWTCIHRYEGSWTDSGDPYWGGLQMDRDFMYTYGWDMIERHHGGFANRWTPLEQMVVANRARVGVNWRGRHIGARGFYPWPNTARFCRLI